MRKINRTSTEKKTERRKRKKEECCDSLREKSIKSLEDDEVYPDD